MRLNRVVITGIGIVSPFGVGKRVLFENLLANRVALRYDKQLNSVLGRISVNGDAPLDLSTHSQRELRQMSRGSVLALIAADEALSDSGLDQAHHKTMGVNIGMGIADLEAIYDAGKLIEKGTARKVTPFFIPRILTNMPGGHVSIRYGMRGPQLSSSTACATGLHAIGDSATLIRIGSAQRMIAGATEACLNSIALTGFRQMRALSSTCSRPFDKERDGFILSEGAALVILERLEDALERGSKIYAEILGYGIAGDAYHLSSPTEDGVGAYLSMERCLHDGNMNPEKITYVNAHATSTPLGDRSEARAIARLLPSVAVSSIKGHIGHTLGAAGAIEAAITALCVSEGVLIGNAALRDTEIDAKVRLLRDSEPWTSQRIALVNSFGFGGSHATICMGPVVN